MDKGRKYEVHGKYLIRPSLISRDVTTNKWPFNLSPRQFMILCIHSVKNFNTRCLQYQVSIHHITWPAGVYELCLEKTNSSARTESVPYESSETDHGFSSLRYVKQVRFECILSRPVPSSALKRLSTPKDRV